MRLGYLSDSLSSLAERITNLHRTCSLLKWSAVHSLARGELFSDYMRKSVCVSFPHQRLGWKQFWVLPGMQELVLKWLTKLLSCKRSTKHYLGIRGGEGKIKGDVEFWMEYLIHLFQNHASRILWPLLKETWTNQSLAFSSFVHRGADRVKLKLLTEAVLPLTSISLSHYKYILNVFYTACTNDSTDQRVFHL